MRGSHFFSYSPQLRQKYESCQKEKMLLRLDRDKLNVKAQGLETTLKERDTAKPDTAAAAAAAATAKKEVPAPFFLLSLFLSLWSLSVVIWVALNAVFFGKQISYHQMAA
jgi:hypothetical protein